MLNRKSQAETKADSSTQDEAAQSVRRHNTNTIVSGSLQSVMNRSIHELIDFFIRRTDLNSDNKVKELLNEFDKEVCQQ